MSLGAADAVALLGQDPRRKNRNHHRVLRREPSRVCELVRRLGGDVDPELQAALDAEDEPPLRCSRSVLDTP